MKKFLSINDNLTASVMVWDNKPSDEHCKVYYQIPEEKRKEFKVTIGKHCGSVEFIRPKYKKEAELISASDLKKIAKWIEEIESEQKEVYYEDLFD